MSDKRGRILKPLPWAYTLGGKHDHAGFLNTRFLIQRQADGRWSVMWLRSPRNEYSMEPSADYARAKCQSWAQEAFDSISTEVPA